MSWSIDADLSFDEIVVSNRLGKLRSYWKPRDILVKFASRRSREKNPQERALLKTKRHPKTIVNEDLTKTRRNFCMKHDNL
jgi:hypothetical protein